MCITCTVCITCTCMYIVWTLHSTNHSANRCTCTGVFVLYSIPSNTKSASEIHPLKCMYLLCRFCKDSADTDDIDGPGDEERNSAMLQLAASKLKKASNDQQDEDSKPKRTVQLNLSVTETDCVVVEDRASLESNAVVLKVICMSLHVHVQ